MTIDVVPEIETHCPLFPYSRDDDLSCDVLTKRKAYRVKDS